MTGMTDPSADQTPPTYAERLAAEQAQRQADRDARRAAIPYNANAPTDTANGDAA